MKNLNTLLERFRQSLGHDTESKEEISSTIQKFTNIRLLSKEISIKNGTLEINTSPTKSSEIRIKEEKILYYLKTERGIEVNKIFYK